MRQNTDSKTFLSGEENYESYLKGISIHDKAILYTILSKLKVKGKEALNNLNVTIQEEKVKIEASRWRISGHINGNEIRIDTVEDTQYR